MARYNGVRTLSRATGDNPMKNVLLPILALSLLTTLPAGAQGIPLGGDNLPRTDQERELGLEGRPRGLREQPGPDEDDVTIEEPDENLDDETLPPTHPPTPRYP